MSVESFSSQELFKTAQQVIPGGVNSPVRSWLSVNSSPRFIQKGKAAYIWDVDSNSYIDYVCSFGPLIFGHAYQPVVDAVLSAATKGLTFGATTQGEVEIAQLIVRAIPSIDMVRLVNSGTEATMSALRLARAYTGRNKIVKFEGCYHGHADYLLIEAGSGLATHGVPTSLGIPPGCAQDTITLPYNSIDALESVFKVYPDQIAGVIIEPVAGNMGIVPTALGFLEKLRYLCTQNGSLLIFDEVLTGFRVGWSGVQGRSGVMPDITCLGKIIGGGLPVGAYGAKTEIMNTVVPTGKMYQAGTLSGNPIAVAAGLATLKSLTLDSYKQLQSKTDIITNGLSSILKRFAIPHRINSMCGAFTVFFTDNDVTDFRTVKNSDMDKYGKFFRRLIERGVYPPPSGYEAWFVSLAHTDNDIHKTLQAAHSAISQL